MPSKGQRKPRRGPANTKRSASIDGVNPIEPPEEFRYVGQSLRMDDEKRFVSGHARYLADLRVSLSAAQIHFIRSPLAHAKILSIDVSRALRHPGVLAVLTGSDLPQSCRHIVTPVDTDDYFAPPRPVLPTEFVSFAGEAIAAVVASSRAVAEDAAEFVEIEYEHLSAVTDVDQALAEGSPRVHHAMSDNILYRRSKTIDEVVGESDDVVTIEREYQTNRVTASPMETRGCVAEWDTSTEVLNVWISTQAPHIFRSAVAPMVDLPESNVVVKVPDVGGGFGAKIPVYPEEVVVCAVARQLRMPIVWLQDRSEDLVGSAHCRDHRYSLRMTAARDGRIKSLHARIRVNAGAFPSYPQGAVLEPDGAVKSLFGPYKVPIFGFETIVVATNKAPTGAYRGVAQPSAVFAMERLLDSLARELGLDPADVRRRNFIQLEDLPYQSQAATTHDVASCPEMLEQALAAVNYDAIRQSQAAGDQIGVGIASFGELTGLGTEAWRGRGVRMVPGYESCIAQMDPGGRMRLSSSIVSQGQSHRTIFAQLAGEVLQVAPERISVSQGDTSEPLYGTGTFASRGALAGGGAVIRAVTLLRSRLISWAGYLLDVDESELEVADGTMRVREETKRSVTFQEIARAAYGLNKQIVAPTTLPAGLYVQATYDPPALTFSYAVHIAVVRVDRRTGRTEFVDYVVVHDCGLEINPAVVHGQMIGGLAQGIGQTFTEELRYDEAGNPQSVILADYCLPRIDDIPAVRCIPFEALSPASIWGIKGVGESGTIGSPAAISNAISDALRDVDFELNTLPAGPNKLWHATRGEQTV